MASSQRSTTKLSRLQTRLFARYQEVLGEFHDAIYEFNKRIDELQTNEMLKLKEVLLQSHKECEEMLQQEQNRVDSLKEHITTHTASGAAADDVLVPFTDCYHNVDMRAEDSNGRMRADRMRVLALCVTAQEMYQKRTAAIDKSEEEMEAREKERRIRLKQLLANFVEALTTIGYTSINGSHVLAQRIIHTINEHLCKNYAGRKALMTQLRCREFLRQRRYSFRLANVYSTSLELMMCSELKWSTTLLQAAQFRRPQCRLHALEKLRQLSDKMKRDGSEFINNMTVIVQSLRRAREPLPTECGQICGGTLPDGWLRGFDGNLFSPIFSVSPSEVTVEWRVKANVLANNAVLQCFSLADSVRIAERQLCSEAESILTSLQNLVKWVCEPEEAEARMLAEASMHGTETAYCCFTVTNTSLLMEFRVKSDESLRPLLAAIQSESEWFVKTLETRLQKQYTLMEDILLTGPNNVLLTFQKVTEALQTTVTNAFGFIRARFIELHEARKDHKDALVQEEKELAENEEKLRRAVTAEEAEEFFAEGLAIFERIAARHTDFHRNTVQLLQRLALGAQGEVQRHCTALLRFVGLESEETCERRLEEERRLELEASTKRGGRAKEVVVESNVDSDESVMPPYPSITAANGQMYYIVAPVIPDEPKKVDRALNSPPPQQRHNRKDVSGRVLSSNGKKNGSSNKQTSQRVGGKAVNELQSKRESSVNSNVSLPPTAVPLSNVFLCAYEALLNDAVHNASTCLFLSAESIEDWREMLRLEVLNWAVRLCESSVEHLHRQCTAQKNAIDVETNEILRHHRRRPAKLQSEIYEGRLRQIEITQMNKEACCSSLRKRFALFQKTWLFAIDDNVVDNQEAKFFEQFEKMEKMIDEANSVNILVLQEKQVATLISSSIEARTNHWNKVISDMSKQKNLLELECRAFLLGCGKNVPANLDEIQDFGYLCDSNDNNGCNQIVDILTQLRTLATAVENRVAADKEEYLQRIDAAKAGYFAAYEKNIGELQVLSRIQEILSRFKVQIHSLISVSTTTEAKIEALVKELEKKLAIPVSLHNFAETLQEITGREYHASLSCGKNCSPHSREDGTARAVMSAKDGSVGTTNTKERALEAEAVLNQRLAELAVETQRKVKSSDTAKVLNILDNLREALYTRGRYLNCLQYGVEFLSLPQEDYIEPRLGVVSESTRGADDTTCSSSVSLPSLHSRSKRRSRTSITQNEAVPAAPYTLLEPPLVISAEREVNDEIAAVKTQVSDSVQQHFLFCHPPLMRRLPGMTGGNLEDVINMCNSVCEQQRQRAMQHVAEATKQYRAQVQRVSEAIRRMPDYLANTMYTLSATSLEQRITTVFDVFSEFYTHSDATRLAYNRLLKVALGSNRNRNKLEILCNAEDDRHVATSATMEKFWGFALRELQMETASHIAKSINVNNNFFALTRGIVKPENLKFVEDNGGSHHKGLRRLLRLKAMDERPKLLQTPQQQGAKRERRLQETLPRYTRAGVIANIKKSDVDDSLSCGLLPLVPPHDVEHGRVPLYDFCPLEEFNTAHPNVAVFLSEQELVPVFAHLFSAPFHSTSTVSRRGAKRILHGSLTNDHTESVAIVAPATVLNKEVAARTLQSVKQFKESSMQVAKRTNETFQKLTSHETAWRATWKASVQRLKT